MTDTNVLTVAPNKPPITVLRERLVSRRDEVKAALTDIDPDHFIRALVTSAQVNPELQAVNFQSLWTAVMRACRDQLLPDGREGAIIPFKSTATWIPMVQGLLKRFRQSGECKWITADVVRQGETFEHFVDEAGEHFKHVPGDNDKAPIVRVYAVALTRSGGFHCAILSMAEVNKIRSMSRATREDSPWKQWPEEMAKKTALRRLSKMLPSGRDILGDDLPGVADAPMIAPQPVERPRTAADALDQFANTPRPSVVGPELDGGEQPGISPTDAEAAATVANDDPIAIAYVAGRRAKLAGMNRRAVPGEYRDLTRQREAMAWHAGYDDKPCPTTDADHAE